MDSLQLVTHNKNPKNFKNNFYVNFITLKTWLNLLTLYIIPVVLVNYNYIPLFGVLRCILTHFNSTNINYH